MSRRTLGQAQGDSLSLLLFVLYIADLADTLKHSSAHYTFYADDLQGFDSSRPSRGISEGHLRLVLEVPPQRQPVEDEIVRFSRSGSYARQDRSLVLNGEKLSS